MTLTSWTAWTTARGTPAFASLYDGSAAYRKLQEGKRNLSAAEETSEQDQKPRC